MYRVFLDNYIAQWLGFRWQEVVKEIWGKIQNEMTGFCFKFKASTIEKELREIKYLGFNCLF